MKHVWSWSWTEGKLQIAGLICGLTADRMSRIQFSFHSFKESLLNRPPRGLVLIVLEYCPIIYRAFHLWWHASRSTHHSCLSSWTVPLYFWRCLSGNVLCRSKNMECLSIQSNAAVTITFWYIMSKWNKKDETMTVTDHRKCVCVCVCVCACVCVCVCVCLTFVASHSHHWQSGCCKAS